MEGQWKGRRRRRAGDAVVVQALADGVPPKDLPAVTGVCYSATRKLLADLRRRYHIRTSYQLVAHFMRNGWID